MGSGASSPQKRPRRANALEWVPPTLDPAYAAQLERRSKHKTILRVRWNDDQREVESILTAALYARRYSVHDLYAADSNPMRDDRCLQIVLLFSHLTYLDLNACGLTHLPVEIGARLRNLQTLCVEFNNLEYLPESITQLGKLEQLFCRHNNLRTLPHDMTPLLTASILLIDFTGNQSLPPPLERAVNDKASIEALFEHARTFQKGPRMRRGIPVVVHTTVPPLGAPERVPARAGDDGCSTSGGARQRRFGLGQLNSECFISP